MAFIGVLIVNHYHNWYRMLEDILEASKNFLKVIYKPDKTCYNSNNTLNERITMKLTNITKIDHGKYILNNVALVIIENGQVTVQYDNTKIANEDVEKLVKQFFVDCTLSEVKEI